METSIRSKIFKIQTEDEFRQLAMDIFRFQSKKNPVFQEYLQQLQIHPRDITAIENIPFLPVQLYKSRKVYTGEQPPEMVFYSSGSTSMSRSRHFVKDPGLYRASLKNSFELFYGDPGQYHILALLPSYLEQDHSSLIYMVRHLIELTGSTYSGFYLDDYPGLIKMIHFLKHESERQVLLIGVSYALLDLAEQFTPDLNGIIVMETGGMKGRRKEMVREELHQELCTKFNVQDIHSEYGMAELLSQAYSCSGGIFRSPPWMRILIRDIYDPFSYVDADRNGGINIIDLANLYSCSFVETQDLGTNTEDGTFKILGRFDHSDVRGCNLMVD